MCFVGFVRIFGLTFWNLMVMEVFSLEEEECGGLFLTQQSNINEGDEQEDENSGENGDDKSFFGLSASDFTSPCVSLVGRNVPNVPQYSDISEGDEDFVDSQKVYKDR